MNANKVFFQPTFFETEVTDHLLPGEQQVARSGTFLDNLKLPVHRWFRYSAGFSARWVESLIMEYHPGLILDPFVGSGTTLLAAEACGITCYGFESHSFVQKIAQAKLLWSYANNLMESSQELISYAKSSTITLGGFMIPSLLQKCYTQESLYQFIQIREAYNHMKDQFPKEVSQLLFLAISSILRSCSFAGTAQWQYILPKKRKTKIEMPFVALESKLREMVNDSQWCTQYGYKDSAILMYHDARNDCKELASNSVDMVITSPPYPNNYDYADSTRLEMSFWGTVNGWSDLQNAVRVNLIHSCSQHTAAEKLSLDKLLENDRLQPIKKELTEICQQLDEIRMTKGGRKTYHTMIAAYFHDLAMVFTSLRRVCCNDANLVFVIGDCAPYGVYVPVDKFLGKIALSAGFKSFSFEKLRDRNTKWKNRKHDVPLKEGRLWIKG